MTTAAEKNLKNLAEMTATELTGLRDHMDDVIRHQDRLIASGEMEDHLHRTTVADRPRLIGFCGDIDTELDRRGA